MSDLHPLQTPRMKRKMAVPVDGLSGSAKNEGAAVGNKVKFAGIVTLVGVVPFPDRSAVVSAAICKYRSKDLSRRRRAELVTTVACTDSTKRKSGLQVSLLLLLYRPFTVALNVSSMSRSSCDVNSVVLTSTLNTMPVSNTVPKIAQSHGGNTLELEQFNRNLVRVNKF